MAAVGAVARRGADHPSRHRVDRGLEHRVPSEVLGAEEAARYDGGRGRRTESEEAFADGRATAEGTLRHPGCPGREAVHVTPSGLYDERHVEEVGDEPDLEVVLA